MSAPILKITTIALSLIASGHVMADDQVDVANVISATPQYSSVNQPREVCRKESRDYAGEASGERSYGGSIIGGVAGGLLGSQIGKGNGKVAAGVAGAIVGAVVGDRIDNSNQPPSRGERRSRVVEVCNMEDNYQSVISGYLVSYSYNGRIYSSTMNRDPGSQVRIIVSVKPY